MTRRGAAKEPLMCGSGEVGEDSGRGFRLHRPGAVPSQSVAGCVVGVHPQVQREKHSTLKLRKNCVRRASGGRDCAMKV